MCEAFNSSIFIARKKPIISILEKIRHQQMLRMNAKRKASQRWSHAFGPRVLSIVHKAKTDARFLKVNYDGNEKFEMSNRDGIR